MSVAIRIRIEADNFLKKNFMILYEYEYVKRWYKQAKSFLKKNFYIALYRVTLKTKIFVQQKIFYVA